MQADIDAVVRALDVLSASAASWGALDLRPCWVPAPPPAPGLWDTSEIALFYHDTPLKDRMLDLEGQKEEEANKMKEEAKKKELAEKFGALESEIGKLKADRKEAEAMRKRERKEHKTIVSEAKFGLSAM